MATQYKLGEALVKAGIIDDFQLQSALGQQRKWGGRLGKSLIDLGFLDETTLIKFLSEQLKFSAVDLSKSKIAPQTFQALPKRVAEKYLAIPVVIRDTPGKKTMVLAMADPTDLKIIDEIEFLTNFRIEPLVALESSIEKLLKSYGQETEPVEEEKSAIAIEESESSRIEVVHGDQAQFAEMQSQYHQQQATNADTKPPVMHEMAETKYDLTKPAHGEPMELEPAHEATELEPAHETMGFEPPDEESFIEMDSLKDVPPEFLEAGHEEAEILDEEEIEEVETIDEKEDSGILEPAETIEDDEDSTEVAIAETVGDAQDFFSAHEPVEEATPVEEGAEIAEAVEAEEVAEAVEAEEVEEVAEAIEDEDTQELEVEEVAEAVVEEADHEAVEEAAVAETVEEAAEADLPFTEIKQELQAIRSEITSLKQKFEGLVMMFVMKEQGKIGLQEFLAEIQKL